MDDPMQEGVIDVRDNDTTWYFVMPRSFWDRLESRCVDNHEFFRDLESPGGSELEDGHSKIMGSGLDVELEIRSPDSAR